MATSSTRSEVFAASDAGAGVAARPGSNPLRWYRSYVLPEKEFEQLKRIDEMLGTRDSAREDSHRNLGTFAEGTFRFGSMYEGALQIERESGLMSALMFMKKMRRRYSKASATHPAVLISRFSAFTLMEGIAENWYAQQPPEFIEKIAGMRSMPALTR